MKRPWASRRLEVGCGGPSGGQLSDVGPARTIHSLYGMSFPRLLIHEAVAGIYPGDEFVTVEFSSTTSVPST